MTDFRALCSELVDELENWTGYGDDAGVFPEADFDGVHALITRARAALAEDPVGPTDDELGLSLSQREQLLEGLSHCFSITSAHEYLKVWNRDYRAGLARRGQP